MKKLCTLFLSLVLCVASALATDYVGTLTIDVKGKVDTQNGKTVSVELTDASQNLYKLSILNFVYAGTIDLGDIVLNDVQGEKQTDGSEKISAENYPLSVSLGGLLPVKVKVNLIGVISADGKTFTTEKLDIADAHTVGTVKCSFSGTAPNTSALSQIVAGDSNSFKVYNLAGREVPSADAPGVYIVRYANGKTKKFIKK